MVFGFQLSDEHIRTIADWEQETEPQILEFQRKKFSSKLSKPLFGDVPSHHKLEISPLDTKDWQIKLSLSGSVVPKVEPLIFERGITAVTEFKSVTSYSDFDFWIGIAHGDYERLLETDWTLATARNYDYYFNPSTIGTATGIRQHGLEEWTDLTNLDEW